jgi:hypothetical protein
MKTCRGCDTCSQAHFEQQHAAALYHLELAHRALEQLETGMFNIPGIKRIANAVKGGVQNLKSVYNKRQLESLRQKLANETNAEEKDRIHAQIRELEQKITTAEAPAGGTIAPAAQMRTNPYCVG